MSGRLALSRSLAARYFFRLLLVSLQSTNQLLKDLTLAPSAGLLVTETTTQILAPAPNLGARGFAKLAAEAPRGYRRANREHASSAAPARRRR